ncbi:MAG: MMPL family transporter [Actinomycetota bacterium]
MERIANLTDRLRWPIVIGWVVLVAIALVASRNLSDLLSNRFDLPDTESTAVLETLEAEFGQRGDSTFLLVVESADGADASPALLEATQAASARAGAALGDAQPGPVQSAGPLAYVAIGTTLEPAQAQLRVEDVRTAIGEVEGGTAYLSGQVAINRDLQPVVDRDLIRGEAIAVPIAAFVLLFIFGTIISTFLPLVFALATVPTTLGIVWIAAHQIDMAIYVTNLVTLIGIGIAIDYSLLVVYRFREEMHRIQRERALPDQEPRLVRLDRDDVREALRPTMRFAGHAVVFSGLTVAVGLAGLIVLPLPFIRSMGVGGLVIPLISIFAAVTLLPALLSILGHRLGYLRVVPKRVLRERMEEEGEHGFWVRLSGAIMRRPWPFLVAGSAILLALAIPTFGISLTPGSNDGLPAQVESVQGMLKLEREVGAGPLAPSQVVVDTGAPDGVWSADQAAAIGRLAGLLRDDPEVGDQPTAVAAPTDLLAEGDTPAARAQAVAAGLVDPTGRYALVTAASRDQYGAEASQALARRIRAEIVPAADFPAAATVEVGGGPAAGIDFIDRAYGAFPWLVLFVLVTSYILLVRAFRSLLLPLKAVILNVLSVAAAYGLLVLVFQDGWGAWAGIEPVGQIEAWIPIFLFAMLFGLSMDYEVFLVTRMRELYDRGLSNADAVAQGLQRTGRIVSAAAIILVAAFGGFLLGSLSAFQQFGLGLAAGILIDATLIRMILVPAFMQIAGDANWYLPDRVARLLRVRPSGRRTAA